MSKQQQQFTEPPPQPATPQFDLTQLNTTERATAGAIMQVEHPGTGEPIAGWTVTVIGVDAPEYQARQKQQARRVLAASAGKGRVKLPDVDEVLDDALDLLIVATKGWTGIQEHGKPLECTPQNVRDVYSRFPWLRQQVDRFIADRAHFLGN